MTALISAPESPTARYFMACKAERVIRKCLLIIFAASLVACASTEPNSRTPEPTAAEVAKLIGCTSDEVALCIEVNCEIEEWRCADRNDVRDMFKASDFNR